MPKKPQAPQYADRVDIEPNYRHVALADWLTEMTGYEVDLKTVQLSQSLTNEFRGSDADLAAKEQYTAEREEAKRQAKLDSLNAADAKIEKQRARLAALEAQKEAARAAILAGRKVVRGKVVEDDEEAEPEPVAKAPARKRAAKKAAPAVEETEATVTPIAKPRRRPGSRPSRAARASAVVADTVTEEDDEF